MIRPLAQEYAPYCALYMDKVPQGVFLLDALAEFHDQTQAYLAKFSEDQANQPYAQGKWTIKELVQHILDSERILAYRALRFGRGDTTELPGFDQDLYVQAAQVAQIPLARILQEWKALRQSNILLFAQFSDEESLRGGMANGHYFTVRAFAYMILGHELHHLQVLKQYLG